jgi:hypothetical protein
MITNDELPYILIYPSTHVDINKVILFNDKKEVAKPGDAVIYYKLKENNHESFNR